MGVRLTQIALGVCTLAWLAGATAAHAFTLQNAPQGGAYDVPQFNLEEQAKQFRKDGTGTKDFSTPLGGGRLQFGVQQGQGSGPATGYRAWRSDFERMLTPENLR